MFKIIIFSMLLIIPTFSMIGCATPKIQQANITTIQQLENKINLLETQLSRKEKEINELESRLREKDYYVSKGLVKSEKEDISLHIPIRKIQLALKNAGFYKGPIDGKSGEQTKRAIREFQKANKLNPDGVVGKKTWLKLSRYSND